MAAGHEVDETREGRAAGHRGTLRGRSLGGIFAHVHAEKIVLAPRRRDAHAELVVDPARLLEALEVADREPRVGQPRVGTGILRLRALAEAVERGDALAEIA